jgi:putative flippase GtrA
MDRHCGVTMHMLLDDPRVRFLMAGGSAALLNWLVRFPLGQFVPYPAAVLAALAIGMSYGFVIYRHWAFMSPGTRPLPVEIRDFLLVNAAGGAITFAVSLGSDWSLTHLRVSTNGAQAAAHALGIAAGAVVNYLGHKHITFRPERAAFSTDARVKPGHDERCAKSRHCERSAAIHGAPSREMDCFVARAPRNDGEAATN